MARENYGPDYAAAMAGARLQWDRLSPAMQRALTESELCHGGRRVCRIDMRTDKALDERGLVDIEFDRLTPMGLLVREAGLAEIARKREAKA